MSWRTPDSAALYEALAELECNLRQKALYLELAAAEREHAGFWAERLRASGTAVPLPCITWRTWLLVRLARWLGGGFVTPVITARELTDHDDYEGQADALEAGLADAEQHHAEQLRAGSSSTVSTKLRAAVLRANDGLAWNFCLLMGVVGGGAQSGTVLLTGIAGLISGALSMAFGEWLSVTNAGEMAESLTDRTARALHRGDGKVRAGSTAREAWSAARVSCELFALGAAVPLAPFTCLGAGHAIDVSIGFSIAGLFGLGLATSLFNGRSAGFSALRQVGIGAAAAVVTYGAGSLVALVGR